MNGSILSPAQSVGNYRAMLGETPVWCCATQSLIWVDIVQQRLLRLWPERGDDIEIHPLPFICSAALLTDQPDQLLLVTSAGLKLYDARRRSFSTLCPWIEDAQTRPNEAAVAPDGSLWFSTMDINAQQVKGSWYRFESGDKEPVQMLGGQHVPNTLLWFGGYAWFGDTFAHRFYRSPAEAMSPETLMSWPSGEFFADGSALDASGLMFNARWGAGCLARYQLTAAAPEFIDTLPLPVQQPSSCAFGGPDLSDLYVTSARDGLLTPTPQDGALLRLHTSFNGQRASLFQL